MLGMLDPRELLDFLANQEARIRTQSADSKSKKRKTEMPNGIDSQNLDIAPRTVCVLEFLTAGTLLPNGVAHVPQCCHSGNLREIIG